MKTKRYKNIDELGKDLGISPERIGISEMKTKLKQRIVKETIKRNVTSAELAELSGLTRTVVSGIVNGSLQSVSLERLIRLAFAIDLVVELNIRKAA
jgi:predicted XRE-type DNA-binding protein